MRTANQIRQEFIDFFVKRHGHTCVPSSPVVPLDDPTLLFTNAGMNQFKDVFLGTGTRPYRRAADTQKCIRAGGKHNDLDDVGRDTYHHTFFEMLGNWSFGDYFKKEAITWAWELLTEVWGMDKSRLHATVFEGDEREGLAPDDEAAELWRTVTDIDPSHIHKGNKKDNFWEMGDTGPCGPCTEIHIDRTQDKSGSRLVNRGTPDVIEIWNLVFIQFNRGADGKLTPLPARHVDTGMGFERVTAVLQNKSSNYDTDVFAPILNAIGRLTGRTYGGKLDDPIDIGFRVIADHLRMATFAISDGARPGNKKRDAVLRSVIRRAVRFGYQYFELREPFICRLVPVLVEDMGNAFPQLKETAGTVQEVLRKEEKEFFNTIQRGLAHFNAVAAAAHKLSESVPGAATGEISGFDAADLHTTHGFPIDLTKQMAAEIGMTVDEAEYQEAMRKHRELSGQGKQTLVITAMQGDLPRTEDAPKYEGLTSTGKILGWVRDNVVEHSGRLEEDEEGEPVGLLLDQTCFYAEQGGQVGDNGTITTPTGTFTVTGTQRLGDAVLHVGQVTRGQVEVGQTATLNVGGDRPHTMRNHTTTHLLNWALRKVLGDHVEQKGSLVDPEKTRFDFTHDKPLTAEQVAEVEGLVNEKIYADLPVTAVTMPLAEAKKIAGVRAVFGEKYPDPVRVLLIGPESAGKATLEDSVEFCGGTHLRHTGQAGFFKIVGQESVARGVRRVVAVTGRGAVEAVQRLSGVVEDLAGQLSCKAEDVPGRVAALQEELKKLQIQMRKGAGSDLNTIGDRLLEEAPEVRGTRILVGEIPSVPPEQVRQQMDRLRQKAKSAVVVVGWTAEDKVGFMCAVTDDVAGKVEAGKLVGEVAKVAGGKGGGRGTIAQAGGTEPAKLAEALETARRLARERLEG
jgi:alanyl-tRNA synthetase